MCIRDRVNIIKNAAESIGETGDIFIRTSVSPTMLEIADTGAGISKEVDVYKRQKADFLRLYLVLLWPGICLVR